STNWMYRLPADYQAGDITRLGNPVIGPDGTLYFQLEERDGGSPWVGALAGASPVACSPWPELGKNARRAASSLPASLAGHLSSPRMLTNGFQFTISAPADTIECICATMDFAVWTNLAQIVIPGGGTNFVDTAARN